MSKTGFGLNLSREIRLTFVSPIKAAPEGTLARRASAMGQGAGEQQVFRPRRVFLVHQAHRQQHTRARSGDVWGTATVKFA